MGVQFSNLVEGKELELVELSGKKIAVDAFNTLYQFLSIIRDRMTGEPLRDSKGNITSHLSGLFYRTSNLIEVGIKPVFVFDGEPPKFKEKTVEERRERKEEAKKKWDEALEKGEPAIRYAQATSKLTDDMVGDSKKLLDYMGVPWIQAPSEGEAQCAHLVNKNIVWASGSQDWDSLLFGSQRFVKNLSIVGRRKVPRKEAYVEIKPEIIELGTVLKNLEIDKEQLIIVGILIGTDYNDGVEGVGPKTALKLVKKYGTLKKILKEVEWNDEYNPEEIVKFFLKPPVTDKYEIEWKLPETEKIVEFMVEQHDFSRERVEKSLEKIRQSFTEGKQTSIQSWLKK